MRFCARCRSRMFFKKVGGRGLLECTSCGYIEKARPEDYEAMEREAISEVPVVEEGAPPTLPITHIPCPECGHGEAHWWIKQTRSADEPSTRFYRCVKCGRTWREYS